MERAHRIQATGGFTYTPRGNKQRHPGLHCRRSLQRAARGTARHGVGQRRAAPPQGTGAQASSPAAASYYYYTHYYAIQAMVQAGDEEYAEWYPADPRCPDQPGRMPSGAWDKGSRHGGGGSYTTPMAIIILATPHRYIPIYQR